MDEPSPRSSRLALASAVGAAIVVGGAGFLLGRTTAQPTEVEQAPPVVVLAPEPSPDPLLSGVLGRAELIDLAAAAADATASGSDPDPKIARVDGRRFEIRLPFGCDGPASEDSNAPMRWHYDAGDKTLRIHVEPVTWTSQDWWPGDEATGIDAIEGFWITRPWTSSEACPPGGDWLAAHGPEPVTLPGQTLAVGQVFFSDGARRGRRNGEPFRTAVRIPEAELDASEGFRLRISGRLTRSRGYGPVGCRRPASSGQRPVCLIGVLMDEVAIENPASGTTLATWSLGGRSSPGA